MRRLSQSISPGPRLTLWLFCNMLNSYSEELLTPCPNPQAGGPPLVGCPRLLMQYIRSCPPYWRPFLHPEWEDAPRRSDRDPLIMDRVSYLYKKHAYFIWMLAGQEYSKSACSVTIYIYEQILPGIRFTIQRTPQETCGFSNESNLKSILDKQVIVMWYRKRKHQTKRQLWSASWGNVNEK